LECPAGLAAEDLVAAAVGDPAEFLHVDVDQFAGPVAFVAADDLADGPVQVGQPVQTVAREMPISAATCATGRPEQTRSTSAMINPGPVSTTLVINTASPCLHQPTSPKSAK
jgi:hypothetical protein